MNDDSLRTAGELQEAVVPFRPEDSGLDRKPALRLEDLRNALLKDEDLTGIEGLLPEHLAGADLTGAKLSDEIAKFPALAQVKEISADTRKIFIGLLAACVYSWLVIGTTTDVALILNTASSPLPIINTPIPIAGFYVVGATLLAAVYCYLHFYLQRLWRTLATLPAVFPDGTALDDKTDPWLLTNLVRTEFAHLRANAPPLARLENLLTIVLAWWLVPLTLVALWARYLPAHYWLGTTLLVALIGATALFGRHSYQLARVWLRGEAPAVEDERDDGQNVLTRALHELRRLRPDKLTAWLTLILAVCSISAFRDNPRDDYTWVAKLLNAAGIRTYADLREVEVAERPDGWTGEDWSSVKRVDLRGRNLAFADATRALVANADLRGTNLQGADLGWAELQGADLSKAQLQGAFLWFAQLQGADLSDARLQGADLTEASLPGVSLRSAQLQGAFLNGAHLQGADLSKAQLRGAHLKEARLQGAVFREAELQRAFLNEAHLQGADLSKAQLEGAYFPGAQLQGAKLTSAQLRGTVLTQARLQGANFSDAQLTGAHLSEAGLQGADLDNADLQGARLWKAQLQGANLTRAQLQGTDMQEAGVWRAQLATAQWDLADLSGTHVKPMADSAIDALISTAAQHVPNEGHGNQVIEALTAALRTADRPAGPDFPEIWRSEPNVMFRPGDPKPQPFDWGPRKWRADDSYAERLAGFLGELACGAGEGQARGLAWRALGIDLPRQKYDRLWPTLFAQRLVDSDCPPFERLPEDMRRRLEQLAARGEEAAAAAGAPAPEPAK